MPYFFKISPQQDFISRPCSMQQQFEGSVHRNQHTCSFNNESICMHVYCLCAYYIVVDRVVRFQGWHLHVLGWVGSTIRERWDFEVQWDFKEIWHIIFLHIQCTCEISRVAFTCIGMSWQHHSRAVGFWGAVRFQGNMAHNFFAYTVYMCTCTLYLCIPIVSDYSWPDGAYEGGDVW